MPAHVHDNHTDMESCDCAFLFSLHVVAYITKCKMDKHFRWRLKQNSLSWTLMHPDSRLFIFKIYKEIYAEIRYINIIVLYIVITYIQTYLKGEFPVCTMSKLCPKRLCLALMIMLT